MTEQSIGDILNDEPAPEAAVEAPPEAETPVEVSEAPAETVERPRGPDGKFVSKGDTETTATAVVSEAPPAPQEDTGHIPIAALKDERSKRQAAEERAAQIEQQLRQLMEAQQQPQQPEAAPDRWEDPEGYDRWLEGRITAAAEQRAIEAFQYQRIATAASQFKADKPDYDQVIGVFGQMAQANSGLMQQMQSSENPARFAYETAKLQMDIQQHGSLQGYIDAQIAAKQTEALSQVQVQLPQSLPPSISSDRSVGSRSGPAWSGPRPLGELLA